MSKIGKNFLYNLLYHVFSLLTPILVTPYITRVIDQKTLGINTIISVTASYFCIFGTMGMSNLGIREIASYKFESMEQKNVFFRLYRLQFNNYLIVIASYIIYCMFSKTYFHIKIVYLIQLLACMLDISWLYQGLEEFKYISIRNVVIRICSTASILAFVKNSSDINLYVICLYLPQMLMNIFMWITAVKKLKLKLTLLKFDYKLYKQLVLLTIPAIASSVYTILDKTILGIFRPEEDVAIYEQGQVLIRIFLSIVPAFSMVVMPRMVSLFQKNDTEIIKKPLELSSNFIWYLSFGLMFGILAISDNFIKWYLPSDYFFVATELKLCSPMMVIVAAEYVIGAQILLPQKKDGEYTISLVGAAITNGLLDLITIKYGGITAACICSVVGEGVALCIQIYFIKRMHIIKLLFKKIYIFIFSGLVMFFLIKKIVLLFSNPVLNLVATFAIGLCVYTVLSGLIYKIDSKLCRRL